MPCDPQEKEYSTSDVTLLKYLSLVISSLTAEGGDTKSTACESDFN